MKDIRDKIQKQIDAKIEVKEVQSALNMCQSDLAEQLTQFKSHVGDKI